MLQDFMGAIQTFINPPAYWNTKLDLAMLIWLVVFFAFCRWLKANQ